MEFIAPSCNESTCVVILVPVLVSCGCAKFFGLFCSIACLLCPFAQAEVKVCTLEFVHIRYKCEERIASRLIQFCILCIACLFYALKQVISIVGHYSATKLHNIVVVVAFVYRTLCNNVTLGQKLICSIDKHQLAVLVVSVHCVVQCLTPRTCFVCIEVGASSPHILYRALNGVGTIVQGALAQQIPCSLYFGVLHAIACMRVVLNPLGNVGLGAHPGELEYKVVCNRCLLNSLGSSTDTLYCRIFCFVLKVIFGKVVQAAHKSRAATEVGDCAEHSILWIIAAVYVEFGLAVREQVEHN